MRIKVCGWRVQEAKGEERREQGTAPPSAQTQAK